MTVGITERTAATTVWAPPSTQPNALNDEWTTTISTPASPSALRPSTMSSWVTTGRESSAAFGWSITVVRAGWMQDSIVAASRRAVYWRRGSDAGASPAGCGCSLAGQPDQSVTTQPQ